MKGSAAHYEELALAELRTADAAMNPGSGRAPEPTERFYSAVSLDRALVYAQLAVAAAHESRPTPPSRIPGSPYAAGSPLYAGEPLHPNRDDV